MSVEFGNLSAMFNSPVWELMRTALPWLTGGLAGSLLTYFLNRRTARRSTPRLKLVQNKVEYMLPSQHRSLKKLSVSYDGSEYETLTLLELKLLNTSQRSVAITPMLISIGERATLVDSDGVAEPVDREMELDPVGGKIGDYLWQGGELKPGDSVRLTLLIASTVNFNWNWRGDDSVDVYSDSDATSSRRATRELQLIVVMFALFNAFGSVPFFGPLIRALIVVAISPYLANYVFSYWWPIVRSHFRRESKIVIHANAPYTNIRFSDKPTKAEGLDPERKQL